MAQAEIQEKNQVVRVDIEAKNFSAWYGKKQALKRLSFDIYEKSITAIIGPSGCGKSTFIRCINRMNDLVPHFRTEGEIFYKGMDVNSEDVDVIELRRRVGMVFQKPNPFPKSIYENIAYGLRIAGVKKRAEIDRAVEESLRRAALWNEVKENLRQSGLSLSGGQQQRLCFARALAVEPSALLLDEPCSALDPTATAKIEEVILELKKDYTIVIVTHNMQQAARISDRTGFFMLGELIEIDRTDKIFTNPSNELTEHYITGRFG